MGKEKTFQTVFNILETTEIYEVYSVRLKVRPITCLFKKLLPKFLAKIFKKFASLVAEITPNKLLEFWDLESLSRRRIKEGVPPKRLFLILGLKRIRKKTNPKKECKFD